MLVTEKPSFGDTRHPQVDIGPTIGLYVWQYPLRFFHWGMVLSIAVLSFTGYYIHNPFIVGQAQHVFLAGWFRFVHEVFGMFFISLFILRIYLFFMGNMWVRWRQYVPTKKEHFIEMINVAKFYGFINPKPISKIGHNHLAASSYLGIYGLVLVEIVTGLVMFNWLRPSAILTPLIGWIPSTLVSFPNIRLIHFVLMFVFIAFAVFHVHLCMLISREEKRGLMDSIFIGYKVVPVDELTEEEQRVALGDES